MNRDWLAAVWLALLILDGCSSVGAPSQGAIPPPPPPAPSAPPPQPDYAVVRTFFATDRNVTGHPEPERMFGNSRSGMVYGSCDVSIPRSHHEGELESPSIWRFEFREDPDKHVVVLSANPVPKDAFFGQIADRAQNAKAAASRRSSALIFVHGYNVSFADAARRTAQISYDLGFDGDPVFFSWPSDGEVAAYMTDEQTIEWAQDDVKNFLDDFLSQTQVDNVYLIAHSMGNRAVTRAVAALLAEKSALKSHLTEVILAAPDIDAEVFKRDIAPALASAGRPVTLYASSKDKALQVSQGVHGYPRAGESGSELVVVPGIETIDATAVDTEFLGHSYFANTKSVLSDMVYLIRDGKRAAQRSELEARDSPSGRYWIFKQ